MQEIYYISNLKGIKTLSSERRLKILRHLVDKEYTAQELASVFNVRPNALWYDMQQLESAGLIELIESEKVRGTIKKYYRAVAKNFFVDVSLGQAEINKSNMLHAILNQEIEDWRRERIIKIKFQDIAHQIINRNLNIKENEVVVISYQPMHRKLVEDLMVEIAQKGAYAIPVFWTKRMEYNFIRHVPLTFATKDVISDYLIDKIDAHIIFSGEFLDEPDGAPLTDEQIRKSELIEEAKRVNVRKTYETDVRFLTIDTIYNNFQKADAEIRSEMYWKALNERASDLSFSCNKIKDILLASNNISAEDANGNFINISLPMERIVQVKDGYADDKATDSELPGGLVVGLLENGSINGSFHSDFAYLYDTYFADVDITIKDNKITSVTSKNNNDTLQKLFKNAHGDKNVVGSFTIGVNPALRQDIGHPYINSKIFGALTLQVGWDELEASAIDSDMIAQFYILDKTIKVDNKILFQNGKLTF
ncbi:MAG TPA: ArsR family transcriptional regulator [Candidatus Cloacimonetes bacterium]|nr:ArsR family transcriptional regulator [Candidatus Cloacimonadota bacterium]HEX37368.1 ArsR family transcriptional regulator [Candidatus Cloacimonadota bacterium]